MCEETAPRCREKLPLIEDENVPLDRGESHDKSAGDIELVGDEDPENAHGRSRWPDFMATKVGEVGWIVDELWEEVDDEENDDEMVVQGSS